MEIKFPKSLKFLLICLAVITLSSIGAATFKLALAAYWQEPVSEPPGDQRPGPVWLQMGEPDPQEGGFAVDGKSIVKGDLWVGDSEDEKNFFVNGECIAGRNCPVVAPDLDTVTDEGHMTDNEIVVGKLTVGFPVSPLSIPPTLNENENLFYGAINPESNGNFFLLETSDDGSDYTKEIRINNEGNMWLAEGNEICFEPDGGDPDDPSDDVCMSAEATLTGDYVELKDPFDEEPVQTGGFNVESGQLSLNLDFVGDGNNAWLNAMQPNNFYVDSEGAVQVAIDKNKSTDDNSDANFRVVDDAGEWLFTVDQSGNASSSGCFGPVFIGTTASTYPVNFLPDYNGEVGYLAVDLACKDEVDSESHVCTMQEILNSINCGWLWEDPDTKNTLKDFVATARDKEPYPFFRIKVGAPALPVQTNDCAGWESQDVVNSSAVWQFDDDGGTGWALPCSNTAYSNYGFACCK